MFNTSQLQYFELQIKECNNRLSDNNLPESDKRYYLGQRDAYINVLNMWEKRNVVERIVNQSYCQSVNVEKTEGTKKEEK